MSEEPEIYTGHLIYKNINFFFTFDKERLCLTPPLEKETDVMCTILMEKMENGVLVWRGIPEMEEAYLVGKCSATGRTIIFITRKGHSVHSHNSVLYVDIIAYIICISGEQKISKISFSAPEIDYIHPTTQGYSALIKEESKNRGIVSVTTTDFEITTTEKQSFQIDENNVQVCLGIQRRITHSIGKPPLSLSSTLIFEFEPTEDYDFIIKAWYVAKGFLQFMCYRKNVFLPISELFISEEDGKYGRFATLYVIGENGDSDQKTLTQRRYIKLSHIIGKEGNILNDIAAQRLYVSQIPETHASGNRIDTARFLLIMAAFEGEFCRFCPEGVPKSKHRVNAREEVKKKIGELSQCNCNKYVREEYEFLQASIDRTSLHEKIRYVGEKLDDIIGIFGKHWYNVNDTSSLYVSMAYRLSKQRNNYAHGNLEFTFTEVLLRDIVYMERIIYAMQLKYYGVKDEKIQQAINDLFGCQISL